jgi:hypothetical protein
MGLSFRDAVAVTLSVVYSSREVRQVQSSFDDDP